MTDSYTPAPPNPKTTLRNPWLLIPLLLAVTAVVTIRLSFTRETVGILYRSVPAVEFHGIRLTPPETSGVWYEYRPWLGKGPDDLKTVWSRGLHYSVFFSLTGETPDIWTRRTELDRIPFSTGGALPLPVSNPCVIAAGAHPAKPRPKVDGMIADLLLKGGVQVKISGKLGQAELERIAALIGC